jgi:hypothetical protein
MAELKTKPTEQSVEDFLQGVSPEQKRRDCLVLVELMREITEKEPRMWGSSMVGFGSYHYKYASGQEGDYFLTGFSPRKQNLTLYIMPGFDRYDDLMGRLGKYTTGKSCLYLKRLEDIDLPTLKELIQQSVNDMRQIYPPGVSL